MNSQYQRLFFSRRQFNQVAPAALLATSNVCAYRKRRPRIAALYTELRFRSHAFNILENFLAPYLFCGKLVDPGVDIVSLYADQFPDGDMSLKVSQQFRIPLFKTIPAALCRGGSVLDVDGILLIGEHGDYPLNERKQVMYPRHKFFMQCADVIHRSGRAIPIFNDKHLSYSWKLAKQMYDQARQLEIPLLAGSSVPLAQQTPPVDTVNKTITQAVSIHGGGFESYDFHAMEVLQSLVESRRGGESGIASVQLLDSEQSFKAIKAGTIPWDLTLGAMQAEERAQFQRLKNTEYARTQPLQIRTLSDLQPHLRHTIRLQYNDGLQAVVLAIGNDANRWNFACRSHVSNRIQATALFNGPWGNRCLFKALSHAIQLFFQGKPVYPIERTLIVNAMIEASLQSRTADNQVVQPDFLNIPYNTRYRGQLSESGKTWQRITHETPQPMTFSPGDLKLLRNDRD